MARNKWVGRGGRWWWGGSISAFLYSTCLIPYRLIVVYSGAVGWRLMAIKSSFILSGRGKRCFFVFLARLSDMI